MAENEDKTQEDDVVFESETDSDNAKDPAEIIKSLKEKLKHAQKEARENLEGWQRTKADYANARKEEEKSRSEFSKFAQEKLIRELIPALQSFHSAFGNKEAWEKVDLNWRMGVQYIYSQLVNVLEGAGLEFIEPQKGEKFDLVRHASVESVPVEKQEEDYTVQEVLQKGFLLHGRVVEPAKVRVGEYHA
jgi:molecular chaperone GrpE